MKSLSVQLGRLAISRERDVIWYLYENGKVTQSELVDVFPSRFNSLATVLADLFSYGLVTYEKESEVYKLTKEGSEYVRRRIG